MSTKPHRYWFPAKRVGWGWGLPDIWQGWVTLLLWCSALVAGSRYVVPPDRYVQVSYVLAMGVLLLIVCLLKGEPPRWRSGDGN